MPHPNGNMKLSGDIHLPELDDLALEDEPQQADRRPSGARSRTDASNDSSLAARAQEADAAQGSSPSEAPDVAVIASSHLKRPYWSGSKPSLARVAGFLVGGLLLYRLVR